MAVKYCLLCERPVEAKRKIGIGTLIAVLITGLGWLLVIPFYRKRCTICAGTSLASSASVAKVRK